MKTIRENWTLTDHNSATQISTFHTFNTTNFDDTCIIVLFLRWLLQTDYIVLDPFDKTKKVAWLQDWKIGGCSSMCTINFQQSNNKSSNRFIFHCDMTCNSKSSSSSNLNDAVAQYDFRLLPFFYAQHPHQHRMWYIYGKNNINFSVMLVFNVSPVQKKGHSLLF